MIFEIAGKLSAPSDIFVDIAGRLGPLAEEIRVSSKRTPMVIEPGPRSAAVYLERSLPVIKKFLMMCSQRTCRTGRQHLLITELFEHLHGPAEFFALTLVSDGIW
jgi:hypothetical protein